MTEIVAEFTTNHLGNLNLLLRMTEEAFKAGADFIKMQKKDVAGFYSAQRLDSPFDSPYGQTYREYRTLLEFGAVDLQRFDENCRSLGARWFSTVQDRASLDFMQVFDLPMYKIASINARNYEFLSHVARAVPHDRRIVMSLGGSDLSEVGRALEFFTNHRVDLLHCVAEYPCRPDALRLGNIPILRERFGSERVRIGYSGHEVGIEPSLAAIALGAEMIERHFAVSRMSFAHHIECSLEPAEFRTLCELGRGPAHLLSRYVDELPREALKSSFGMSDTEKRFLIGHHYGTPPAVEEPT